MPYNGVGGTVCLPAYVNENVEDAATNGEAGENVSSSKVHCCGGGDCPLVS